MVSCDIYIIGLLLTSGLRYADLRRAFISRASGALAFLGSPNRGFSKLGSNSNPKHTTRFRSNQTGSPVQPASPSFDFLSFLGRLPGRHDPFWHSYSIHSFLLDAPVTMNRPSEPETTVPHLNCSIRVQPPGTLCTCTSCLEQPVLYRFTSLHCCLRSRPLSCRSLLSRPLTCAVITRLSFFNLSASPRSLLHVIHISTIDTTRIQSLCTIFLVQRRLFSLSLLPRLPLPFGLSVSYPPFCLMPQPTYTSPAYRT